MHHATFSSLLRPDHQVFSLMLVLHRSICLLYLLMQAFSIQFLPQGLHRCAGASSSHPLHVLIITLPDNDVGVAGALEGEPELAAKLAAMADLAAAMADRNRRRPKSEGCAH